MKTVKTLILACTGLFLLLFTSNAIAQVNVFPEEGNAGIGVLDPDARLQITGDPYLKIPSILLTQKAKRPNLIHFRNTSNSDRLWGMSANPGHDKTKFNFWYEANDSTSNTILTLTGDKKVGINTTNPEQALQVNGGLLVHSGTGNLNIGYPGGDQWKFSTIGGGKNLQLWTTPEDEDQQLVAYFKQNGNVGIGTSNPKAKLQVEGDFLVNSSKGNMSIGYPSGHQWKFNTIGGGATLQLWTNPSGSPSSLVANFKQNGNMGVGISNPTQKLHVSGNRLRLSTQGNANRYIEMRTDGAHMDLNANNGNLYLHANTGNTIIQRFGGKVGMGTSYIPAGYKLAVDGRIICEELKVQMSGDWPDYVFEDNYDLMPLEELEAEIEAKGHLPGIPSAEVIESEGLTVGEMQRKMMEKIEELTLYVIDLKKENQELREMIEK